MRTVMYNKLQRPYLGRPKMYEEDNHIPVVIAVAMAILILIVLIIDCCVSPLIPASRDLELVPLCSDSH